MAAKKKPSTKYAWSEEKVKNGRIVSTRLVGTKVNNGKTIYHQAKTSDALVSPRKKASKSSPRKSR